MRRLVLALVLALIPAISAAQIVPNGQWAGVTPPVFGGPSSGVTGSGAVIAPQLLAPDGTAAAPSYSFASDTDTGFYREGSGVVTFAANTLPYVQLGSSLGLAADSTIGWSTTAGNATAAKDVSLSRGAANRLDLATGDSYNMVGGGGSFQMATVPIISSTAPTVTSAGTGPSVAGTNTAAFRVNVGTGGTATTIVMAMPTATTGWNCNAENLTGQAANRANQQVVQQSSTTTAVTVQNQTISTGAALAFTASDIVAFLCMAY